MSDEIVSDDQAGPGLSTDVHARTFTDGAASLTLILERPVWLVGKNAVLWDGLVDYLDAEQIRWDILGAFAFKKVVFSKPFDVDTGLLIVNIDDFGGLSPLYRKIRVFRNSYADVPVIFTSASFGANDLSLERVYVCDVSLCLPSPGLSVESCFMAAYMNNTVWQQRVKDDRALTAGSTVQKKWWRGQQKIEMNS
jgi:hypothetical protein